jgi:predicted secreted Zn-dependent protease
LFCSVNLEEHSYRQAIPKKSHEIVSPINCPAEFRPSYLLLSPFYQNRTPIVYYSVRGDNLQQVYKDRSVNAPKDGGGSWRDAIFKWHLSWDWNTSPINGFIQAESISFSERSSVHLPCWVYSAHLSVNEKREWHRFINALVVHEQTHLNNYIKCVRKIETYLAKLKQSKLVVTPAEADKELRGYIMKLNISDLSFDQRTNHGRAQGSVLVVTPE